MSKLLGTISTASLLMIFAASAQAQTGNQTHDSQQAQVYQSKTYGQPAESLYTIRSPQSFSHYPLAKTYSSREEALRDVRVEIFDTPIPAYGTQPVHRASSTQAPTYIAQSANYSYGAQTNYDTQYTIAAGDTLYNIASRHGLKASQLMNANGLTSSTIAPGQVLTIPSSAQTLVQAVPSYEAPVTSASAQVVRNVTPLPAYGNIYAVLPGDTLFSIARRTCSTVSDIAMASGISESGVLSPGQRLTMPPGACLN